MRVVVPGALEPTAPERSFRLLINDRLQLETDTGGDFLGPVPAGRLTVTLAPDQLSSTEYLVKEQVDLNLSPGQEESFQLTIAQWGERTVELGHPDGTFRQDGIAVYLDGEHFAYTDSLGQAKFTRVTLGAHTLSLEPSTLPTHWQLPPPLHVIVSSGEKKTARIDIPPRKH